MMVVALTLSLLSIGCGEKQILTDDGLQADAGLRTNPQQVTGRTPPPTLASNRGDGGATAGATTVRNPANTGGEETVNFAHGEVALSPVWLEQQDFIVAGEVKTAIRVATSLPPTKGTLFVLLRLSRWAQAEDLAPIKFDDVVVTIRQHDNASLWNFPDLWPGITSMISIMPLEMLEEQPLPRATAELHTITSEHEFVPYETTEEHRHLVFPPE